MILRKSAQFITGSLQRLSIILTIGTRYLIKRKLRTFQSLKIRTALCGRKCVQLLQSSMRKNPGCPSCQLLSIFGNRSGKTSFLHLLDTLSVMSYFKKNVIVVFSLIILTLHIEDRLLLSFQTIVSIRFQLVNGILVFRIICPGSNRGQV